MKAILSLVWSFALLGQATSAPYFPAGNFDDSEQLSKNREDWYSRELRNLGEPSLLENSTNKSAQVYRFLWLRSFRHPVAIRLDILPDGMGLLTAKMASGADGHEETKLVLNDEQQLTKKQVDWFLRVVEKEGFWDLKAFDHSVMGADGAEWIIEGAKEGRYHVVDRWSPEKGPVYSLGMAMLRMSKL